ncbi:hypothetical protein EV361DRAFT_957024 [Lentinula raphanica]|nr:hypothetical protein EV361DRAFT_957024 [Lentinula raphanica]
MPSPSLGKVQLVLARLKPHTQQPDSNPTARNPTPGEVRYPVPGLSGPGLAGSRIGFAYRALYVAPRTWLCTERVSALNPLTGIQTGGHLQDLGYERERDLLGLKPNMDSFWTIELPLASPAAPASPPLPEQAGIDSSTHSAYTLHGYQGPSMLATAAAYAPQSKNDPSKAANEDMKGAI